jgi:hypothetical protein
MVTLIIATFVGNALLGKLVCMLLVLCATTGALTSIMTGANWRSSKQQKGGEGSSRYRPNPVHSTQSSSHFLCWLNLLDWFGTGTKFGCKFTVTVWLQPCGALAPIGRLAEAVVPVYPSPREPSFWVCRQSTWSSMHRGKLITNRSGTAPSQTCLSKRDGLVPD